jgi:predicted RNA binding protein YcfA (HicA-like mRNA interferase family)
MPKLRVFSGAELCELLMRHGFAKVRQKGSHVIMRSGSISLPVPLHRQVDRGTLSAIIRQSGLPRAIFEV